MKKPGFRLSHRFLPIRRPSLWRDIPDRDWTNWIWQQQNRVRDLITLEKVIRLSDTERSSFAKAKEQFRVAITPYYLSLMDPDNENCPIRRQAIPQLGELVKLSHELLDPSNEEKMSPVPGIVHRYPDRVLLYTTHHCAVYCRFCTRKRKVSDPTSQPGFPELSQAIEYIQMNKEIREVVVSGGDALSNSDDRLLQILDKLAEISHLDIIRIGSRNLVTLPYRVSTKLAQAISRYSPIYFHTHFNHPAECTYEAFEACQKLADAGIPLQNHTVLLKGVNDSVETIRELNLKLLAMRVKPYYLYQCDQVFGNSDFRTKIQTGLDIIKGLRGWSSGLGVPHFVVDTEGGGKVALLDSSASRIGEGIWKIRNYKDNEYFYYE